MEQPTVLVTGAAKRIGRGLAMRLAREGYKVGVHYNTSREEAQETAGQCGGELFQADLESIADLQRMFGEVETRFGRLDALVNNAARFARLDPLEITEADWDFIHSVNLKATFFCCQAAARIMKRQASGRIVNISSLGGLRPWADHAHYCASKAGVIMLTKALAKAWAPEITVNSVAPGVIPFNDMNASSQKMVDATPAQRAGTADEVADAVVFFLKTNNFITGQVIAVDGGLSLR